MPVCRSEGARAADLDQVPRVPVQLCKDHALSCGQGDPNLHTKKPKGTRLCIRDLSEAAQAVVRCSGVGHHRQHLACQEGSLAMQLASKAFSKCFLTNGQERQAERGQHSSQI